MKLIRTILKRPVSAILIILAVVVFGAGSLLGMPLEYFPDVELPMELIMVVYPGADADSIAELVTEPIEKEVEGLSNVKQVNSMTADNYAMIQVSYNYGADLDDAYMDLRTSMDALAPDLPAECEEPLIMELDMDAIATLSLSVSSVSGVDVETYLEDNVVPKLERLEGVARVEVSGAREEYLRVVLQEDKLQQYGLTISSVGSAIAAADFNMPLGSVTVGDQDVALSAYGNIQMESPDLRDIPIQTRSGQIVRLSDVAGFIGLYKADPESVSRYNGENSVILEVTKQDRASTIDVCSRVLAELEAMSGDISCRVTYSEGDSIVETLTEVLKTLVIGVVLTMAVLFLFFGNFKASVIVGCSMPLSILLSVALLYAAGYAVDLMTGTALVLAIGMIVDNSIVVLESCFRCKAEGLDFRQAAVRGAGTVMMSVFASTLTTVVVYIPLMLIQGLSGQMSGPMCWTMIFTMSSSLLCAVTAVPLFFFLVKPRAREELPINRLLTKIQGFYRRVTPRLLRRPGRTVAAAALLLACALLLAGRLDFVLFPDNYDGSVRITATFRSGTKLSVMDESVQALEQALLEDENFSGVTLSLSENTAAFTAYAAPDSRRSSEAAVEAYARRFGGSVNMDVTVEPTGAGGMGELMDSGNAVGITLTGRDLDALEIAAGQVSDTMAQVPGVIKIDNAFAQTQVKGRVVIDAQKALNAGTTPAAIAGQIYMLVNGSTAATVDYGGQEYDVKLEYPAGRYDDLTALLDRPVYTNSGALITLGDIADIEYISTLPSLSRQDGIYTTEITATTTAAARSDATKAITSAVSALAYPEGVSRGQSYTDQMNDEEFSSLALALAAGIFLVFLVMAVQFDSARLSVMVMMCIPFSLIGSVLAIFLTGSPISIIGVMGFLMLFGIVVNNGILLVDTTNQLREDMPLEEALIPAGSIRLRPILMTSLTTILSMVPMILSNDSGVGMMKEMGLVIVGGLVASTVLALFMMPSFYLLIRGERADGTKVRLRRKKTAAAAEQK